MREIQKICVIGAGVMGAGIAAHVANAGHEVILLDIVPEGATNRNVIAEGAVQKLLKANPAAFMHKRNAKLVITGNIEDNLDLISGCDWVIEAVIERLDIKQDLYRKIEKVRKPTCVVSSNTSTIPLETLVQGLSDDFAKNFIVTHFFNPPRYMRLLEVVRGPKTDAQAIEAVSHFCDHKLGKSVIECKDSPGFIANRLGIFWMGMALQEAITYGLSVEETDAVAGKPCGVPKTGIFGLMDLVGLDLMPHVVGSMQQALPQTDMLHLYFKGVPLVEDMIKDGYTGRKGKGGFYRMNSEGGAKVKESVNLNDRSYAKSTKSTLVSGKFKPKDLRKLLTHPDRGGQYAHAMLTKTLAYAASLVPEAAEKISDVDEAMRLGYNWKFGPFELIDMIGADWLVERLIEDGVEIPPLLKTAGDRKFYQVVDGQRQELNYSGEYIDMVRPEGVLMLEDIKRTSQPIMKNASAALWDIGDGVVCFEFTSMMNSLDPQIMQLMQKSLMVVQKKYKAMVVYNEGENFSVGANLGIALFSANIAAWSEIEAMVKAGQETLKAVKYAPFPVVAAPSGMALGGGCEFLLHSDAVQPHAETYAGLVEVGVGLIPGWGGCKEMLARWTTNPRHPKGPMPAASKVFEMVSTAQVGKSAEEARDMMILRKSDKITMNRYRLLADAKARALGMVEGYEPPAETSFRLAGKTGQIAFKMAVDGFVKTGKATPHDEVVSAHLAQVLNGGGKADITNELSEDDILELEREMFMKLVRHPDTLARVEHMLLKNKPLRN
jgi:3-hydroxyacyl-CoA dehydrogenase